MSNTGRWTVVLLLFVVFECLAGPQHRQRLAKASKADDVLVALVIGGAIEPIGQATRSRHSGGALDVVGLCCQS